MTQQTIQEWLAEVMKHPPTERELQNAKHTADLIDAEILKTILGANT